VQKSFLYSWRETQFFVMPAKAGIQKGRYWMPAFAGMTEVMIWELKFFRSAPVPLGQTSKKNLILVTPHLLRGLVSKLIKKASVHDKNLIHM